MGQQDARTIAVTGATGLQGGAVTRRLLSEGWRVRGLTRDPEKRRARAIAALGAEVVRADMSDPASLEAAFEGAHGVFSVQNHHISGYEGEVIQGKNVADVAERAGVRHLVYASAGTGARGTGVGSWETKLDVTEHTRSLDIPLTILRPMAFMELMTEKKFFPPASVWHVMPELMGSSRPVVWLTVDDQAFIAAKAFANPGGFVGRELVLASDVRSIDECRELWREVAGKPPRRFPMPVWLFERFVGKDETTMWRWLRDHEIDLDTGPTLAVHPEALSVREWLVRKLKPAAGRLARERKGMAS